MCIYIELQGGVGGGIVICMEHGAIYNLFSEETVESESLAF